MKRNLIAVAVLSLASTVDFAYGTTTSSSSDAGGLAYATSGGTAMAYATSTQGAISSPFNVSTGVTATQTTASWGNGGAIAGSGGTANSSFTFPSWHH